jgi:hypothetical protein
MRCNVVFFKKGFFYCCKNDQGTYGREEPYILGPFSHIYIGGISSETMHRARRHSGDSFSTRQKEEDSRAQFFYML